MKRIKKFMRDDFGCGGIHNYTLEQAEKLRAILGIMFCGTFSCAEISSIAKFLTELNTDTESAPMIECFEEATDILSDWGI